jgi:hypothetical protein
MSNGSKACGLGKACRGCREFGGSPGRGGIGAYKFTGGAQSAVPDVPKTKLNDVILLDTTLSEPIISCLAPFPSITKLIYTRFYAIMQSHSR